MSDEIEEIINKPKILMLSYGNYISLDDYVKLKDYITNLQQENENLKEDNWAYHQLLKVGNKREYRSKFLKDFQKEYGENVFPDYDEIYKRYDDYKSRIEKAVEYINEMCLCTDGYANYGDDLVPEHIIDFLQGGKDE